MTAIVAFKYEGKTYIAGDRCGSNGYTKLLVEVPKIFKVGNFYIGYTHSFYMGQLLEHTWTPPPRMADYSDDQYLYKQVFKSIKNCLIDNNFGKIFDDKHGEPDLGTFIIVYKDRIFIHQPNGSVLEVEHAGVGCGGETVLTSLLTAFDLDCNYILRDIIAVAYKRCSEFSCGVSPEFDLLEIIND